MAKTSTLVRISTAAKRQQQETAEQQSVVEAAIKFNNSFNNPEVTNVQRFQAAAMILWLNDKNRYAKPHSTDVDRAIVVRDETKEEFDAYIMQMESDRARRYACQRASAWFDKVEEACDRLKQNLQRYREICDPEKTVSFTDRATQLSWAVNEVQNMTRNLPMADAVCVATSLAQAFADEKPTRSLHND